MTLVPILSLRRDEQPDAPPTNLDAEQSVLGAVLASNEAFHLIDGLTAEHFSEPFHGALWATIAERIGKGLLAEPVGLMERFKTDSRFAQFGGLRFLADLADKGPPPSMAAHFSGIVIESAHRRLLLELSSEIRCGARSPGVPIEDVVRDVETYLAALSGERDRKQGFVDFSTAVESAMIAAEAAYRRDPSMSGLPTGLIDLDQKLGGLHPSDLIILAGRPSMGKTALASNIAFHLASRYSHDNDGNRVAGARVGFFSLEMSKEQLAARLICDAAGISSNRVRRGDVDAAEFGRLRDAADLIQSIPLHIDETGAISVTKLAARARRLKRQQGLDLIVVDYLQLCSGSKTYRGGERVQEVSDITQSLKALAKELDVPVLALSQLSRRVEERDDKRPQLADLRESGSIEQDADAVLFVYREEYYLKRSEPKPGSTQHAAWLDEIERCQCQAEVIIGKQRHGPIGTVKLSFNEDLTHFGNLAREGRGIDFSSMRMPYGGDQ